MTQIIIIGTSFTIESCKYSGAIVSILDLAKIEKELTVSLEEMIMYEDNDTKLSDFELSQLYSVKDKIRQYHGRYENVLKLFKQYNEKIDNLSKDIETEIHPNVDNFKNWDGKQVVNFILSLSDEYVKYKDELLKQFKEQSFKGSYLPDLEKNDLLQFGIKHFGDRSKIYKALKSVVNGTFSSANEGE